VCICVKVSVCICVKVSVCVCVKVSVCMCTYLMRTESVIILTCFFGKRIGLMPGYS